MPTLFKYVCPVCHYHAEVSGGEVTGKGSTFATIACTDCQKLYDIMISQAEPETPQFTEDGLPQKRKPLKICCPKRTSHPIVKWKEGDACPQCGSEMQNKGAGLTWGE